MTEAFLQYVWQHRLLVGPLATTDGLPVVVERPGELNRDAGPDFFDSRLSINGVDWAGCIEVHIKASDWRLHGHSSDKRYNNVILHVVYHYDADITLEDGRTVPTLEIDNAIPQHIWDNYDALMNPRENFEIPCAPRIKEIPHFLFNINQERMLVERMERKTEDVRRLLNDSHGNWEQVCYWLTARYFGGKTNAFPFELLAKITPMQVLAKIKNNPFRVEALFFGQAGMLENNFADEFPKAMKREYCYLQTAYKLKPMDEHQWKFFRIRPPSFPTLRISQFAALIAQSSSLFSKLLDTDNINDLRSFFDVMASDYWSSHYRFDKAVADKPRPLGNAFVDNLLINAWAPLLFEYGAQHGRQEWRDRAFSLLEQLPAEKNRVSALWADAGTPPSNAAESQASIQRYNEYCLRRRCLNCQLAFRLINTKK